MKKLALFLPVLWLTACSTTNDYSVDYVPPPTPYSYQPTPTPPQEPMDYTNLLQTLHMDRPNEVLGYKEKSFNTCKVGRSFSSTDGCHTEYFVTINFQLLCRSTEDTVSSTLTEDDITPLGGRYVHWKLHNNTGNMQLDQHGFGQIRFTTKDSQKAKHLKLTVGNDFVYLRADEITRLITPNEWCYTYGAR